MGEIGNPYKMLMEEQKGKISFGRVDLDWMIVLNES
jgi:hypothetical protein